MIPLMFLAQFYGVVQVLFLASFSRTIRWQAALLAFFAGIALCSPIALLLQLSWTHLYAAVTQQPYAAVVNFAAYTFDPLIEEVAKVLPLLLVCLVPRVRQQLGLADIVLLCLASGSGFGLTEDILRFSYTAGLGAMSTGAGNWLFPFGSNIVLVPGPVSTFFSWVPQGATAISLNSPGQIGTNVHLALSALVGFAIGLCLRRRGFFRQGSWRKTTVIVLAALFCFALAVLVHMATNTPYAEASQNVFWNIILVVFGQGIEQHFLALFPLIAVGGAVTLDYLNFHQVAPFSQPLRFATEKQSAFGLFRQAEKLLSRPRLLIHCWTFVLLRRTYMLNRALAPNDPMLAGRFIELTRIRLSLELRRPLRAMGFVARLRPSNTFVPFAAFQPSRPDPSTLATVPLSHFVGAPFPVTQPLQDVSRLSTVPLEPQAGSDVRPQDRLSRRLFLLFSLLLALPTFLYFVVGSIPLLAGVQNWLASSPVFLLLKCLLLAGLLWRTVTIVTKILGLPRLLKQTNGQVILAGLFGMMLGLGSLVTGAGSELVSLLSGGGPLHPSISGHILDALAASPLLGLLLLALLSLLLALLFPLVDALILEILPLLARVPGILGIIGLIAALTNPVILVDEEEFGENAPAELGGDPSITIPPGAPQPSEPPVGPINVFRPMEPGEDPKTYGQLMHEQGLPNYMQQAYPNAQYELNVIPGQTGPDVEPISGLNMEYGELKPILTDQGDLQWQIENWGSEINRTRLFFYDRNGNIYEGIVDVPLF